MEPVSRHVHLIRGPIGTGFVAIYAVLGRRTALIDTGFAGHPGTDIDPGFATLGLSLRDVDIVLTTHGHADHVGGHSSVVCASNAVIGVHAVDRPRMEGLWKRPIPIDDFLADFRAIGRANRAAERTAFLIEHSGAPVAARLDLADADRIDLGAGVEIEVVETPGHTGGSVSFLVHPDETALVGDAIQGLGGSSGLPLYEDPESYRSSLARIAELDATVVGLGHGFRSGHLHDSSPLVASATLPPLLEESRSFPLIADHVAGLVAAAGVTSLGDAVRLFLRDLPAPFDGLDADLGSVGAASLHAALLHLEQARALHGADDALGTIGPGAG